MDIVSALRKLFDTFKPGGEGQASAGRVAGVQETYRGVKIKDGDV